MGLECLTRRPDTGALPLALAAQWAFSEDTQPRALPALGRASTPGLPWSLPAGSQPQYLSVTKRLFLRVSSYASSLLRFGSITASCFCSL